jgi:hypothetical protein
LARATASRVRARSFGVSSISERLLKPIAAGVSPKAALIARGSLLHPCGIVSRPLPPEGAVLWQERSPLIFVDASISPPTQAVNDLASSLERSVP